jgi:DNA-binding NarL/FixJ family response regulator
MKLSPRQRECLELVARGLSNKEIARELSIAVCSVKRHLALAFLKMEVKNRTAAAVAYRSVAA